MRIDQDRRIYGELVGDIKYTCLHLVGFIPNLVTCRSDAADTLSNIRVREPIKARITCGKITL